MSKYPMFSLLVFIPIFLTLPLTVTSVFAQGESAPQGTSQPEEVTVAPVVVTATRTERSLADMPVSVSVVTRQDVKDAPAIGTDDILRTIPGINMPFLNSFTQHPTGNLPICWILASAQKIHERNDSDQYDCQYHK